MSEYQYYEFAAIDKPLTRADMAQLRAVSTRAEITPSGFVNHYEWGDLKADPADWMRRYFDAFVHTANWCSCRLALRVPQATFQAAALKPFVTGQALTIEASGKHWIIDWSLDEGEDQDRFAAEDGSSWMRRLVPLRDELLRGDQRPLYLRGQTLGRHRGAVPTRFGVQLWTGSEGVGRPGGRLCADVQPRRVRLRAAPPAVTPCDAQCADGPLGQGRPVVQMRPRQPCHARSTKTPTSLEHRHLDKTQHTPSASPI